MRRQLARRDPNSRSRLRIHHESFCTFHLNPFKDTQKPFLYIVISEDPKLVAFRLAKSRRIHALSPSQPPAPTPKGWESHPHCSRAAEGWSEGVLFATSCKPFISGDGERRCPAGEAPRFLAEPAPRARCTPRYAQQCGYTQPKKVKKDLVERISILFTTLGLRSRCHQHRWRQ